MEEIDQPTYHGEIIYVGDEDLTADADHEIAMMHSNATRRNGSSSTQTRGESLPSPLAALQGQLTISKITKSSRLSNPLAGSSKRESLPIHNNTLSDTQEMVGKFTIKPDVVRLESCINNLRKTAVAMPTSSNQPQQSSKSPHRQRISVVSENFLRYGCQQAPVPERSIERNSNVQSTQEMTPATQTLINLMKRQSQFSQKIQKHTSLKIHERAPHQRLRGLEIPDRYTEVNCIGQSSHPPNVTKSTPSVVRKCANSANLPHLIAKRPQKNQCPLPYKDNLPQNVGTTSTGLRFIGDEKPRQSIENYTVPAVQNYAAPVVQNYAASAVQNYAAPAVQNLSNLVDQSGQTFEKAQEEQSLRPYNVLVQQNSQVNKIIITNANEAESNDQRKSSPSISKNALYAEQNFLKIANQLCQMYKHTNEQQLPPASRELHSQQNPADNVIVRTTTGGKPLDLLHVSRNDTKRYQPSVQQFPSIETQFDRLPKTSNLFQTPAQLQNDVRQVAHTHRCVAGEYTAANGLNQRPSLRDTRQNTPSALQNLPTNQTLQNPEHQPLPVLKGYLLQDPRSKLLFLSEAKEVNGNYKNPLIQSTTENAPPGPQTVSTSTHQLNQPFDHSRKDQFAVDCRKAELSTQRAQQMFQRGPVTTDGTNEKVNPQNIIQNISVAVQDPSNSAAYSPCSCKCSHERLLSSVTPRQSSQDPRIPLISVSTEGNSGRQTVYPETDKQNKSSAKQNSTNLATYEQPYTQEDQKYIRSTSCSQSISDYKPTAPNSPDLTNSSLEPSIAKRHSPMNKDSSDAVNISEKSVESSCFETATKDGSTGNQNSTNVINKSESAKAEAHQALINDFKLLFSQMKSNLSDTLQVYKDMSSANVEYDKALKKVMDIVTDQYKSRINRIVSSGSKKVEKPRNKRKRRTVMKSDENNVLDDHDDNEECYEPSKQKRSRKNSFVLPPEYNPEDSRWTLKHQKALPGIVELLPRSRVYIDAKKLVHCKRKARDCKTLARMLLTEIFSENALRVCSLTGTRAKAFHNHEVRPGLDGPARMVMLTFVEEYGRKKRWVVYDTLSVLNSVRSKVQELRKKAGNSSTE